MNRQEFFKTNYGDRLEVTWDGNVWVTSCGMQCSSASEAMKVELHDFLIASGDDDPFNDPPTVEYDELKLADHGEWE